MKLSRASIALYMGLVFASGLALGVYGDKYYAAKVAEEKAKNRKRPPSPEEFRKSFLSKLQKDLLLSNDQVKQINAIMDQTRASTDDLTRKHRPEYDEIQRQHREKMLNVFTPEQRLKYEAMRPPKNSKPKSKPNDKP